MARKAPRRRAKAQRGAAPAGERRYQWVDTGARTAYANSCSLQSSAEAVFAHFGIDERLEHRIVISPTMAKRLAALLAKIVNDYEARYGELRLE